MSSAGFGFTTHATPEGVAMLMTITNGSGWP